MKSLMESHLFEFEQFLYNGTGKHPGELRCPPEGLSLNLGSGSSPIDDGATLNLDLPDWRAPKLYQPVERVDGTTTHMRIMDEEVAQIHMYHFLEHLDSDNALRMLMECERVLVPDGVINIVVPHAMCELGYQALDHRTFWTESTFQDLFYNKGYDPTFDDHEWSLNISYMIVAGVAYRNLCVLCQLIKADIKSVWSRD